MIILSIFAIGAVGLLFVNQFNKRLIDIKRELVDTTQELKRKVEALEQVVRDGGIPPSKQQNARPEPKPIITEPPPIVHQPPSQPVFTQPPSSPSVESISSGTPKCPNARELTHPIAPS